MDSPVVAEQIATKRPPHREHRRAAWALLVLIVIGVGWGFYRLLFEAMISMHLPDHQPVPIDYPPQELTSFEINAGGSAFVPQTISIDRDTVFIAFRGSSLIYVYSGDLKFLKKIDLARPLPVSPRSLVMRDSFLIVADGSDSGVLIYDRQGYYLSSFNLYPDHQTRIRPNHLSSDGRLLVVCDQIERKISLVSLLERQPFYTFMELLQQIPATTELKLTDPACALILPQNKLAIAESGRAYLFTFSGNLLRELEQSPRTGMRQPVDLALIEGTKIAGNEDHAGGSVSQSDWRLHLLDKEVGKIFVYDLTGHLTLIYPQNGHLNDPTSIAVNPLRRHIYVAETGSGKVTVFGY